MLGSSAGFGCGRPNIDNRDLERVGFADVFGFGASFSFSFFGILSAGVEAVSGAVCRASWACLIPSRISAVDAPCGAVVVRVWVARICPSGESSFIFPISSSVTRRSFSRRTSRPRLWQYHSTNRSTNRVNRCQLRT